MERISSMAYPWWRYSPKAKGILTACHVWH